MADASKGSTRINPQPVIDYNKGNVSETGIFLTNTWRMGFEVSGVLCYYSFTAIASGILKPVGHICR